MYRTLLRIKSIFCAMWFSASLPLEPNENFLRIRSGRDAIVVVSGRYKVNTEFHHLVARPVYKRILSNVAGMNL
jgi:hypothetical protein